MSGADTANQGLFMSADDKRDGVRLQTFDGKPYACVGNNCTYQHRCTVPRDGRYCLKGILTPGKGGAVFVVQHREPLGAF